MSDLLRPHLQWAAHARECPVCVAFIRRLQGGNPLRLVEFRCCDGRNLVANITGALGVVPLKSGWRDRLVRMAQLEAGWFDGQGERIAPERIAQATAILEKLEALKVEGTHTYPTIEGAIQLAWNAGEWVVETDLALQGGIFVSAIRLNDRTSLDLGITDTPNNEAIAEGIALFLRGLKGGAS